MALSLNEKHREVTAWLVRLYPEEDEPQYEISSDTVEVLYHLMTRNQMMDHDTQLIIDDMRQKTDEYSIEAKRIRQILDSVQLIPSAMSKSGVASLNTLVHLATLLRLSDTSDTSYFLALSDLRQQIMDVAHQRKIEQRATEKLLAKTTIEMLKSDQLKKTLEELEERSIVEGPQFQKKAQKAGFMQLKVKEYRKNIKQYQAKLAKTAVDTSLYHHELVRNAETLESLKKELIPLVAKLFSYKDLPPKLPICRSRDPDYLKKSTTGMNGSGMEPVTPEDITLAKVKIAEMGHQLTDLEEQILQKIDLMHM